MLLVKIINFKKIPLTVTLRILYIKRKIFLGLTFLNPHVYLDTVILLGSISNQFGADKWFFVTGAVIASFVWFISIGFGAKSASRFMSRPIFWKILDSLIAVIMLSIAAFLAFYNFN